MGPSFLGPPNVVAASSRLWSPSSGQARALPAPCPRPREGRGPAGFRRFRSQQPGDPLVAFGSSPPGRRTSGDRAARPATGRVRVRAAVRHGVPLDRGRAREPRRPASGEREPSCHGACHRSDGTRRAAGSRGSELRELAEPLAVETGAGRPRGVSRTHGRGAEAA